MLYKYTVKNNAGPKDLSVKLMGEPKGEEDGQRDSGMQTEAMWLHHPPKQRLNPGVLQPSHLTDSGCPVCYSEKKNTLCTLQRKENRYS